MFEKTFKDFKIRFKDQKTYLYAFVSGETDSLEISNQYWTEVIKECKRSNHNKLLVVEEFKNQVSTMEMYESCKFIADLFGGGSFRIAFMDINLDHDELNKFGETVARNRGVVGKLFNTVKEAETWLEKE